MIEKRSLVPSLAHKVFQKWLRNLASLSDTMILGKPWSLTTYLKKSFEMWETSSTLWQGIKCVILLNLSTTTKIKSTPLWVLGSPRTNSILMSTQGADGMGKGVYSPRGITPDLAYKQATHLVQCLWTSFFIWGQ